jgi:VanZ family protein
MTDARAPAGSRVDRGRLMLYIWIGYWVVLTGLLLSPKLPRPPVQISRRGLVAHFVAFGLLSLGRVLVARLRGERIGAGWAIGWTLAFAIYGGVVELLQPYVNRSFDWADMAANIAGAAIVMLAGIVLLPAPRPAPPVNLSP